MQFTAKTVAEAIALALEELKITEEQAIITVIEEPTKGLFGRIKNVEITCYTDAMVVEFVVNYLKTIISSSKLILYITIPDFEDSLNGNPIKFLALL